MFLCYIDESGTSAIPGNTSHFVLAGLSIPIWEWKNFETDILKIKSDFALEDSEIHTAWILRSYLEQTRIAGFEAMNYADRRSAVLRERRRELLRLQTAGGGRRYKQVRKNYIKTEAYVHLTHNERKQFIEEVAIKISNWGSARLFAECIDKIYFDPTKTSRTVDEQSFSQLVSRFEQYLQITNNYGGSQTNFGILIHDNNETVAKRHTELMKQFHRGGTLWTKIKNIIETPLFVNSELTSMIQIADLCSYSLRRYLENEEDWLFKHVFKRADRKDGKVVGIRHFTDNCTCEICNNH